MGLGSMENWIEITKRLRAEGSLEKTLAHLNDVLKSRPNDPVVYYQIAWTHDALGKESDAVAAYEKAIAMGLSGDDLEGAFLGLGSTYRCLGNYKKSEHVLKDGINAFPNNAALRVFYALTQFNLQNSDLAMEILLKELARSSSDEQIKKYSKALLFYSDKLNQKFE